MLSLMLNPRFKSFHLVSFYVGRKQRMFIVEEYDMKALYPMFLKCYQIYLHSMGESEFGGVASNEDDDCRLNIF